MQKEYVMFTAQYNGHQNYKLILLTISANSLCSTHKFRRARLGVTFDAIIIFEQLKKVS